MATNKTEWLPIKRMAIDKTEWLSKYDDISWRFCHTNKKHHFCRKSTQLPHFTTFMITHLLLSPSGDLGIGLV